MPSSAKLHATLCLVRSIFPFACYPTTSAALVCRTLRVKPQPRNDVVHHLSASSGRETISDIVIINPRFNVSFWGMEKCMGLLGKRANLPVACLPLLAALVPPRHEVTIIDENVEEIDFDRVARADLVCVTGMSVQGRRIREVLREARVIRGCFTVVGGPMATVEPEKLEDFADVLFYRRGRYHVSEVPHRMGTGHT